MPPVVVDVEAEERASQAVVIDFSKIKDLVEEWIRLLWQNFPPIYSASDVEEPSDSFHTRPVAVRFAYRLRLSSTRTLLTIS